MRNNECGRSMIEMLGVIAIVGILTIGGIAGFNKAMHKQKTNRLMDQMALLTMNIRTLFANRTDFTGLNNKNLLDAGYVPGDMYTPGQSTSDITHIFSGEVVIIPSSLNGSANHAFEVHVGRITDTTCLALSTMDWGQDPASGFIGLYIGTNPDDLENPVMDGVNSPANSDPAHGIYTPGHHQYSIPLSPSMALQSCQCNNNCIVGLKYF